MDHAAEQRSQFEQAAERIAPAPQGPLTDGDLAEPAHTEAAALTPITPTQAAK
jgi:hypothetical protein